MNDFKKLLLESPDSQIDSSLKQLIKDWSPTPSSLEILKSLDYGIHHSSGSGFVIVVLQTLLDDALKKENKTLDQILPQATWRK